MKRIPTLVVTSFMLLSFAVPTVSTAAGLTSGQVSAIIGLLQAFGVDQAILLKVEQTLGVAAVAAAPELAPSLAIPHLSSAGSPYTPSGLGFDLSFATSVMPGGGDFFNFGVVGVTGGKAFVDNKRLPGEVNWANTGSINKPTIYMNLNAPYGSTVAANIGSPKTCPASALTTGEPNACEGYNYGYNAAAHSYAYAKNNSFTSSMWWLDIEEANSWSTDTSVNDATIQGAIDYLNAHQIRVGIYSVQNMWNNIAGTSFSPSQTINGSAVSVPSWYAIGTSNQIGALNTCVTRNGFFPASPIWVVQYEANSTAVDQNIAC